MTLIAPSILAVQSAGLADATIIADNAGADWIHLDIMDGHFVPNLTFGPMVVKLLRDLTKRPFDAHLMVTNPDDLIPELLKIGTQYITVHQEACLHLHRTLSMIRDGGAKAGVALNPGTPMETLLAILPMVDLIVIMAVNPGFAGQKHIPESARKVARVSQIARKHGWEGLMQVDGGVNVDTAGALVMAGADCLVAGASAFKRRKDDKPSADSDYSEQVRINIEDLRTACNVAIEEGVDPF